VKRKESKFFNTQNLVRLNLYLQANVCKGRGTDNFSIIPNGNKLRTNLSWSIVHISSSDIGWDNFANPLQTVNRMYCQSAQDFRDWPLKRKSLEIDIIKISTGFPSTQLSSRIALEKFRCEIFVKTFSNIWLNAEKLERITYSMLLEKAVGNQLMLNNGGCRAAPFLFVSPKIYKAVLAQLSLFNIEIGGADTKTVDSARRVSHSSA
jgi:hypothetical protein